MRYRNNPLEQIAKRYSPSKLVHNYYQHYWTHFRDVAEEVRNVCEIGVASGESLRVWREFFPNATIHGIDIDPKCEQHNGERIRIHIGSQADGDFLTSFLSKVDGPLDIVVDDGSHIPEHQVFTMNRLFWNMSEHGIYVIEDTGSVVGDFQNRTINAIRSLTDAVNYWPPGFAPQHWGYLGRFPDNASIHAKVVTGLAFYRWMAFVFKGNNPGDNPYLMTPERLQEDLAASKQTFDRREDWQG